MVKLPWFFPTFAFLRSGPFIAGIICAVRIFVSKPALAEVRADLSQYLSSGRDNTLLVLSSSSGLILDLCLGGV